MAITIPINDVAMTPVINMEEFRQRVTDYAAALWLEMADAEAAKLKQTDITHHTSERIARLGLRGGQKVAANIDESEALYLAKYV